MKKNKMIMILTLISFFVFSCFEVENEYEFESNDFAYDVSVWFMWDDFQPEGKDTISLYVETDEEIGNSNLRILSQVEIDGNEIRIEFTGIYSPPIVHCDEAPASANIELALNGKDNLYKIVFFSGDSISTASLRYYKLLGKYVLKPIKETNVTINECILYVEE